MNLRMALPLGIVAAVAFVAIVVAQRPGDEIPTLDLDVNRDGYVNSLDLMDVAMHFGPVGDNPCVPLLRYATPVALYDAGGVFYSNLATQLEIPPEHPQYAAFMAGTPVNFWVCP